MNKTELKIALTRRGMSARGLASAIGMPETTLSIKMRGETEFKGSEIQAIAQVLCLNMGQVNEIFFDGYVN